MKIFVIADTHFGHRKLVEVGDRPEDFSEQIIAHWERLVQADDMVIHLGDVVVSPDPRWWERVRALPGRKILVRGNHDRHPHGWYIEQGFTFACDAFCWNGSGLRLLFTHAPAALNREFDLNLHGHLHLCRHRGGPPSPKHRLISLELLDYEPALLEAFLLK